MFQKRSDEIRWEIRRTILLSTVPVSSVSREPIRARVCVQRTNESAANHQQQWRQCREPSRAHLNRVSSYLGVYKQVSWHLGQYTHHQHWHRNKTNTLKVACLPPLLTTQLYSYSSTETHRDVLQHHKHGPRQSLETARGPAAVARNLPGHCILLRHQQHRGSTPASRDGTAK